MLKTYITGIVLGVIAAIAMVYVTPVVDVAREASIVSVTPNGGNFETFHVNVPADRIMIGAQGRREPLPDGLEWPEDPQFANAQTEIFKLRNSRDAVVGVASRFALEDAENGNVLEWVLHLPARGSLYVTMQPTPTGNGARLGDMRVGTREFRELVGDVRERWVPDSNGGGSGPSGRIELQASYISTREVDLEMADMEAEGE